MARYRREGNESLGDNSVRLILDSVSSIEKDTPPVSVHILDKFLGN